MSDFNISDDEAANIVIISNVGHVIGGLVGAYLFDKIGRKYTILLLAIPQFFGFFLTYCSIYGVYWFYVARTVGKLYPIF